MTGLRKKKFPAAQIQALFTQNPLFTFGLYCQIWKRRPIYNTYFDKFLNCGCLLCSVLK